MRWVGRAWVFVVAGLLAAPVAAQTPSPGLATKTLDGRAFVVPDDLPQLPSLLIVGFSRDASVQTRAWSRQVAQDEVLRRAVAVYQVAVIAGVPAMFRESAASSVRRSVPDALHDHFLLASDNGSGWQQLVAYAHPDSAYLLLLDRQHRVVWQQAGSVDPAALAALRAQSANLADPP